MRRIVLGLALLSLLALAPPASAWTWPLRGDVLRPYSVGPDAYAAGQHRGADVAGAPGEVVRAPAAGVVSFAGVVPGSGRTVTIQLDGYWVSLTHLGEIGVSKGAAVAEGDAVGTAGSSGDAEWPTTYVHLGIRTAAAADAYVDPATLLPPRTVAPPPAAPPAPAPAPVAVTVAAPASTPPASTAPAAAPPAAAPPAAAPAPPGGELAITAPAPSAGSDVAQPGTAEPAVTVARPVQAPVARPTSAAAAPASAAVRPTPGGSSMVSQDSGARSVEVNGETQVDRIETDVSPSSAARAGMRAAAGARPEAARPTPVAERPPTRSGSTVAFSTSSAGNGRTRITRAAVSARDRSPIVREQRVADAATPAVSARSDVAGKDRSPRHLSLAGTPLRSRILPIVLCAVAALGAAAHVRRRNQRVLLV